MRTIHTLPLVAAILLAGCGGSDEGVSADEVAAEAAGMVQPRPGQYRATLELLEFDVPGIPESAKQMAQEAFASGLTSHEYCLTAEDAAEQMVKNVADGDCTTETFNVSGGTVVAEMQCAMEDGVTSRMRMEGEMTTEGSVMTMDTSQEIEGMGESRMKMRVTSQRIGDCTG